MVASTIRLLRKACYLGSSWGLIEKLYFGNTSFKFIVRKLKEGGIILFKILKTLMFNGLKYEMNFHDL